MEKRTAAIILAAGKGTRIGGKTPKQYLTIGQYPLLYYSLKAFSDSFVDEIVLVCSEQDRQYCLEQIVEKYGFDKVKRIVAGGRERYHSVYNALMALGGTDGGDGYKPCDIVFIHDAARPFADGDIIKRAYDATLEYKATVIAVPAKDTVKLADAEGFAHETMRRDLVWQMQTPQTFDFREIFNAYSKLIESEKELAEKGVSVTDDAMVLELFSDRRVKLVMGDYTNIKVTTPEDIALAECLIRQKGLEEC